MHGLIAGSWIRKLIISCGLVLIGNDHGKKTSTRELSDKILWGMTGGKALLS
jgi:hypothetical protein